MLAEARRVPPVILGVVEEAPLRVALERPQRQRPGDVNPLWPTIRQRTAAIGFESYRDFERGSLPTGDVDDPCQKDIAGSVTRLRNMHGRLHEHMTGVGAYQLLKTATEAFLLMECGVFLRQAAIVPADEARRTGVFMSAADLTEKLAEFLGNGESALPYLRHIADTALSDSDHVNSPFCEGILDSTVIACSGPCLLELIWSYWLEEAMLVQPSAQSHCASRTNAAAGRPSRWLLSPWTRSGR